VLSAQADHDWHGLGFAAVAEKGSIQRKATSIYAGKNAFQNSTLAMLIATSFCRRTSWAKVPRLF